MQEHNLHFVVLLEPMIDSRKLTKVCRKIKMESSYSASDGVSKIWVMWKEPLRFYLFHCHDQVVTFSVEEHGRASAFLSFVYAKCSVLERRDLWQQLSSLSTSISLPWMVGDDFNVILDVEEKLGGNPPEVRALDDFHDALLSSNLMDAGFQGTLGATTRKEPHALELGWIDA